MKALVLCSAIALALVAGCSDQQAAAPVAAAQAAATAVSPVVNVPEIAQQPPEVVAQLLGQPSECRAALNGQACMYPDGTEVAYIDGLADWITVNAPLPYSADALPLMGFTPAEPTFSNESTLRWSGVQGMQLIQLAPGEKGQTFFAYVKVRTP